MPSTQGISTACPSLTVWKSVGPRTHHPRSEGGDGRRWFKCFKKAGIKRRDSLAHFQSKEALVRQERTSKCKLKSHRQRCNPPKSQSRNKTQSLRFPQAELQLGSSQTPAKRERSSYVQKRPAASHAERSGERDYTFRHGEMKQLLRMYIKCCDFFSSALLFRAPRIKLCCGDNRSLSSSFHLFL